MMERCPHEVKDKYSPCPTECRYAECSRPQHVIATDVALLLDATVDRKTAVKGTCMFCEHFIKNGPRLAADGA